MQNIRIDIEYDGTGFAGWQKQAGNIPTIQGTLESVLCRILQEDIRIAGGGRTDRGVHARVQTASFATASCMELPRLMHAVNALLPLTVRIAGIRTVPPSFHARFSAVRREYRYFLIERPSAIEGRFSGCCNGRPEQQVMNRIASMIVGEHDFTAFSKENPQQTGRTCVVYDASWHRDRQFHVFRITANRFLRSMVRFLVAGMVESGMGRLDPDEFTFMLGSGIRAVPLVPAASNGLFLWKIVYA